VNFQQKKAEHCGVWSQDHAAVVVVVGELS